MILNVKLMAASIFLIIGVILVTDLKTEAAPPIDSEKVANHLEFLGYETETTESSLKARHPNKFTVFLRKYDGGILIYFYFKLKEDAKKNRLEYLEFINRVNARLTVARAIAHKNDLLKFEGWFPGVYDKAYFILFFEEWNNDIYRNFYKERDGIKRFLQ